MSSSVLDVKGPLVFENWRAASRGNDSVGGYECTLFSDSSVIGETIVGPYEFMNTIAHASRAVRQPTYDLAPVIVLRVNIHMEFEAPRMDKTETSTYHGGSLPDEVAALAALAMGARLQAGPITRDFSAGADPRGRPVAYYGYRFPVLFQDEAGSRLPGITGNRSLEDLAWLSSSFGKTPADESALVRAARLYQDALWIADSEPALSWLFLVAAVETAANQWDQSKASPIERFKYSKPELAETISSQCPDLLPVLADKLADSIGATRKFVEFTLRFLPSAPSARPSAPFRISWNSADLKSVLRTIYGHRSKALHSGIPFPAPMCYPPGRFSEDATAPPEKPHFGAASTFGSVWLAKDIPMHLHVFEYITRHVLKSWWSSL